VDDGVDAEVARVQAQVDELEQEVAARGDYTAQVEQVLKSLHAVRPGTVAAGQLPEGARFLLLSFGFALVVAGGFAFDEVIGSAVTTLAFVGLIFEAVR
jgi:hypothetical protein